MNRTKAVEEIINDFQEIKHKLFSTSVYSFKKNKIPQSQWMVIKIITQEKIVTVKDIRVAFGISSSAATQLVNSLVKKGYVIRTNHPYDKRATKLEITSKLKKSFSEIKKRNKKEVLKLFSALNDKDFLNYKKLQNKLLQSIKYNK